MTCTATPRATPGFRGTIVVVGASVAGVAAAEALRSNGFTGSIVLADASPERPHDKPALSKQILTAELDEEDIELITKERVRELDIELQLGEPATGLDPVARTIDFQTRQLRYDGAIIAAGAQARLPAALGGLDGVHVIRSLSDARAIAARMLDDKPKVVVVGGGFIGCEVAAAAIQNGLEATIVESCDRILARALPAELGTPIRRLHSDSGVEILCNQEVVGLVGSQQVSGVRLADSSVVAADLVVVGVGATPCTEWLAGSGLHLDDGIITDAALRTSAPGVFAAGDIARRVGPSGTTGCRTEHWTDAREQGRLAARNLVRGTCDAYERPSYVWSDQYGHRLQMLGECGDSVEFLSGGPYESYVALSRRAGELCGVVAFDDAAGFRQARKLLTEPVERREIS